MDFTNRSSQPQSQASHSAPAVTQPQAPQSTKPERHSGNQKNKGVLLWRVVAICWLFALTILMAATIFLVSLGSPSQYNLVDKGNYQAVFLTNGQVYFGHVNSINKDYVQLSDVFYLTQETDSKNKVSSNYTLVKLGCQQIHDPFDQMVINRGQVTFWENLHPNGKVATSIQEYDKQNPNGPDCSVQPSNDTQASSNTNTQPAANPNEQNTSSSSSATTPNKDKSTTKTNNGGPAKP